MADKILLFIPMYNCEKQICRVLSQLTADVLEYITEVIVVNNRSTDNGENIVIKYLKHNKNLPVKLLRNNNNYGLGGSHKVAFKYAEDNGFNYLIVLHGDDQGSIRNILPYLKNKEYRNWDSLLGARFMRGSSLQGYSLFRTFGNIVYNMLFSVVTKRWIYDLGSGLNMYKISSLQDKFYFKFKDNLVFNYCMILGSAYKKQKINFFPISWREDDQVSNVKMVNQAIVVLQLLFSYAMDKNKFVQTEHRDKSISSYDATVVYSNYEA